MLTQENISHHVKFSSVCRVVVRKDEKLAQISQFVVEGLQIGQQVVAMAGPKFLRELAQELGECGLRSEALLRNGRLVFLTAPNCLSSLIKPDETLQRGPVRPNAPLLRWVSDWSWAYGKTVEPTAVSEYQRRVQISFALWTPYRSVLFTTIWTGIRCWQCSQTTDALRARAIIRLAFLRRYSRKASRINKTFQTDRGEGVAFLCIGLRNIREGCFCEVTKHPISVPKLFDWPTMSQSHAFHPCGLSGLYTERRILNGEALISF